jgi:hypothetical protein
MGIGEIIEHPIASAEGKAPEEPAGREEGDHTPAHPIGHEKTPATPAGKEAKGKKNRDLILIIVGVVGLILTFIIFKRGSSTTAATTATTPSTGTVAGSSGSSGSSEPEADSVAAALNSYEAAAQSAYSSLADQQTSDQNANVSAQQGLTASLASLASELSSLEAGGSNATGNGSSPAGGDASGPPSLSAALEAQLKSNGEYITQVVDDASGGYLYLTQKGGVYNSDGSPNYGSYLGLPASAQNQTGTFTSITPLSGGGYTETDTQGSSYSFGAGPGQTNLTGAA